MPLSERIWPRTPRRIRRSHKTSITSTNPPNAAEQRLSLAGLCEINSPYVRRCSLRSLATKSLWKPLVDISVDHSYSEATISVLLTTGIPSWLARHNPTVNNPTETPYKTACHDITEKMKIESHEADIYGDHADRADDL